jgi:hypothetical protein
MVGLTGQSLPMLRVSKFARFAEDLGEAVGEPIEATTRRAVEQGAAEHLQHMLSSE